MLSLNFVVAVLNLIHIVIISKLKKTGNSVFLITLYYTNVIDILYAIFGAAIYSCSLKTITFGNIEAVLVITTMFLSVTFLRCISLLFTLIDRWLILSKPMFYESSLFVRHFSMWLALSTVGVSAYSIALAVISFEMQFLDANFGFLLCEGTSGLYCLTYLVPFVILNIITIVFGCLFLYEFKVFYRRQRANIEDKERKEVANYVFVSTIMFIIVTAVISAAVAVSLLLSIDSMRLLINFFRQVYGVLNIFCFLFTTKAYQQKLKAMFSWRSSRVSS